MSKTYWIIILCIITFSFSSCKKKTIYGYFQGDWYLIQENHNGIIYNFQRGQFDWSIYPCVSGPQDGWCSSAVIYTVPSAGNYNLDYRFSPDNKWIILDNSANIDSLGIITFTPDSLVTSNIAPGVVEIDTYIR